MIHLRPGICSPINSSRSRSRLSKLENSDNSSSEIVVKRETNLHDRQIDQMTRERHAAGNDGVALLDQHRDDVAQTMGR